MTLRAVALRNEDPNQGYLNPAKDLISSSLARSLSPLSPCSSERLIALRLYGRVRNEEARSVSSQFGGGGGGARDRAHRCSFFWCGRRRRSRRCESGR